MIYLSWNFKLTDYSIENKIYDHNLNIDVTCDFHWINMWLKIVNYVYLFLQNKKKINKTSIIDIYNEWFSLIAFEQIHTVNK